jgi:uncharacterized LabA/DUF88 family protein
MQKVIAYVDGFNLYFGLKSQNWQRYLWLNVQGLAQHLLKPDQALVHTKYFTSRIGSFSIFYGQYQRIPQHCPRCKLDYHIPSEKMTDVNIAVELMLDAFQDRFDTVLLISADSDLVGPVAAVRRLFPQKRIVIAFPPSRFSVALAKAATAYLKIGRQPIAKSIFPDHVTTATGFILQRPATWK